ncbi:phosphoribosylglycinamide formyltransferase [Rickettsiales bacterium]|nr:phosphoribosylglycinamide formyltransferase [Rickettsiales bacterium]
MHKINLAVLISGRGSNLQAIINSCKQENFPARVACVVSNNPKAGGLDIAARENIKNFTISNNKIDEEINNILQQIQVDLVCLAGFMKIIGPELVGKWMHKMINIHPSLLPAFKGLAAQKQALEAGVKFTGCTVHYVYPEIDSGPIILQAAVPTMNNDTVESLSNRILAAEHKCYCLAIQLIATGKVRIRGNRAIISKEQNSNLLTIN